jgi:LPS-assembly protein
LGAFVLACSAQAADQPVPQKTVDNGVLLRADQFDFDMNTSVATARGHVEVDDQGRMLMADQVTYDQKSDTVTASGHVSVLDDKGNVAFADEVTLSNRMRDGVLQSFAALIGKTGRLVAANGKRVAGRFTFMNHAAYTPCKICREQGQRTPLWSVSAKHVVYDQLKHEITFTNATFELAGVPIAYTPYLTEPDPTVKYATGILPPDFGNSTNIGYFVRVPVYVSISDSEDATFAPLVSSKGGVVLETEYRRRWNEGGMWLQASGAYNPNGGNSGDQAQWYAHVFGAGRTPIDDVWRTGFDVQYSSNDTYLKRYDISQLDRLVNDLFVQGETGRSRFQTTSYYFQGLRATDNADLIPYILPLVQYTYIPTQDVAHGQFRFDINSAVIQQETGPDSQRFTAEARWRLPLVTGDGQLLSILGDVRGDVYHVGNNNPCYPALPPCPPGTVPTIPLKSQYISRGIPYLLVDWRWPFVRPMTGGRAVVIEPLAQLIAQPYGGNPAGIPNEDSTAFEFDENNVFSADQLPGYDLVQSGPRANVGFRAEALFPSGSVETVWGQTYRLKPDPIFASDSGETGTVSDIVGRVSVKFLPYIDLTERIDLDRKDGTVRRNEIYLTGIYDRSTLVISYVQLPAEPVTLGLPRRQEINAQADINFYDNWQAFGAIRRDLIAGQMLDTELGLGYEDECLGISVAYRRKFTSDRDLPPSTSIVLRFNLKTGEEPIKPFGLFPRDVFAHP